MLDKRKKTALYASTCDCAWVDAFGHVSACVCVLACMCTSSEKKTGRKLIKKIRKNEHMRRVKKEMKN